jgi:hypothetical protein
VSRGGAEPRREKMTPFGFSNLHGSVFPCLNVNDFWISGEGVEAERGECSRRFSQLKFYVHK